MENYNRSVAMQTQMMHWTTSIPIEGSSTPSIHLLSRFPPELSIPALIVCALVTIIGVIGNLLTVIALVKCKKLRSSTTSLIINLSAADLFFCSCLMPFRFLTYLGVQKIECGIFLFFFFGNITLSLMTMTVIGINRYLLVLHTDFHNRIFTKRGTMIVILIVWIYSLLLWSVPMIGSGWAHYEVMQGLPFCVLIDKTKSAGMFFGFFGSILPCVIMTITYVAIFVKVKLASAKLAAGSQRQTERHMAFTRVLLVAYISFMVCFVPNFIIFINPHTRNNSVAITIKEMLMSLSSCSNPLIYVLCSRIYRQAYKDIFVLKKNTVESSQKKSTNTFNLMETAVENSSRV